MTDTIASLKQELKVLGPVDYSTNTRQQREMILGQIAELSAPVEEQERMAAKEAAAAFVDAVNKAYNEESIYGMQAPYGLINEAETHGAGTKAEAIALAVDYLGRNPE